MDLIYIQTHLSENLIVFLWKWEREEACVQSEMTVLTVTSTSKEVKTSANYKQEFWEFVKYSRQNLKISESSFLQRLWT